MFPRITVIIGSNCMSSYWCLDCRSFDSISNEGGEIIDSLEDCYMCENLECHVKKNLRAIEKLYFKNMFCCRCSRKLYFAYFIILYQLNVFGLLPNNFRPICCFCKRDGKEPIFR